MKRIKNRKRHFRISNPLGFSLFCAMVILIIGLIVGLVFFFTSGAFKETLRCFNAKLQEDGSSAAPATEQATPTPYATDIPSTAPTASSVETPDVGTPAPETPTPPPIAPETQDPDASGNPTKDPNGPLAGITVGLDPTRDGGSKYKTEGKFNLELAQKLGEYLESKGATVVITRDNNSKSVSNSTRAKKLKNAKCDIAIRLMCNHISSKSTGCYVQSPKKYKTFAINLVNAYSAASGIRLQPGKTHGYEQKSDDVTSKSGCPCVLLILGNWDNKSDRAIIQDEEVQQKIFEAIYEQILAETRK